MGERRYPRGKGSDGQRPSVRCGFRPGGTGRRPLRADHRHRRLLLLPHPGDAHLLRREVPPTPAGPGQRDARHHGQSPARVPLDPDPLPRRPGHLLLRLARVHRPSDPAGRGHGGVRQRAVVDVRGQVSGRADRDQRDPRPAGEAGQIHPLRVRRPPRVLPAGFPGEDGHDPRQDYHPLAATGPARAVSNLLHGLLRDRPLEHAGAVDRDAAARIRGVGRKRGTRRGRGEGARTGRRPGRADREERRLPQLPRRRREGEDRPEPARPVRDEGSPRGGEERDGRRGIPSRIDRGTWREGREGIPQRDADVQDLDAAG